MCCVEDAHLSVCQDDDGVGLHPESSDLFLSAISDEFYDVYSGAYYDSGTP
jgi:hypothetical protein